MSHKVIVVGGGIAGMQTAVSLAERGFSPLLLEKSERTGGKLTGWHRPFPTFTPASEVLGELSTRLERSGAEVRTNTEVSRIGERGVELADGTRLEADAVVVCSGFDLFNARLKEEYGYGIYPNVYTSADLEAMFNEGRVLTAEGRKPQRIALLHCVGSRDEKVGQRHCSRVCCITGVKQAIELKRLYPAAEVYNFYMDIRMFGPGYEEMYRQAQQEYGIRFVRGRISEAGETIDHRVQIKAEDTLVGRPLKMTVDMLILLIGMKPGAGNVRFAESPAVELAPSGFVRPQDSFLRNVCSGAPNIFYAGTVTAPKNVGESLNEAITAADRVARYLSGRP